MELTSLGHACFTLSQQKETLIFDPFLSNNPFAPVKPGDVKPSYILVSHMHADHFGDTEVIAKVNEATVISTAEVAGYCAGKGLKTHKMHIGGKHAFPFGWVKLTPALHGSGIAGGLACGFLIDFYGKTVYFAGDTGLFSDMQYIGNHHPDVALLPIGDNFTMGPDDALECAGLVKARTVIPMHYNTWPQIKQDPEAFRTAVETKTESKVIILAPGESLELKA